MHVNIGKHLVASATSVPLTWLGEIHAGQAGGVLSGPH